MYYTTNREEDLRQWRKKMDEVLSNLMLTFLQLERSGKCCHGVSLSQCHVLDSLLKKESLSMNELSKQMGLAKSTMTRVVNNMVRKGWIMRTKDQEDSRLVNIRLTWKGKEMAEKLDVSSQEYVQRVLNHISSEKIPQVLQCLEWVVQSLKKEL